MNCHLEGKEKGEGGGIQTCKATLLLNKSSYGSKVEALVCHSGEPTYCSNNPPHSRAPWGYANEYTSKYINIRHLTQKVQRRLSLQCCVFIIVSSCVVLVTLFHPVNTSSAKTKQQGAKNSLLFFDLLLGLNLSRQTELDSDGLVST